MATMSKVSSLLFFSILAVIGTIPLFFLVAASMRLSLEQAKDVTHSFLEKWVKYSPLEIRNAIRSVVGSASGFSLLIALSFGFNALGDNTMPYYSSLVGHFHNRKVAWSIEHEGDWDHFRDDFEIEWKKEHADQAWSDFKTVALEKWRVRAARTLFYFSGLMIAAGLIDLLSKRFRRRAVALLLIGLVATTICLNEWVERKAHYIDEISRQNRSLRVPVTGPDSLKAYDNR